MKNKKLLWLALIALPLLAVVFAFGAQDTAAEPQAPDERTQNADTPEAAESSVFFDEAQIKRPTENFEKTDIRIKQKSGDVLNFTVELAETPSQKAQGLMHRTELDENAGMLFLFPHSQKVAFWMKNTLIPLDMLFLSNDGGIHHIHHNAKPQDLTRITSELDSSAVLELSGGTADRLGIKVGDMVLHPVFKNDHMH